MQKAPFPNKAILPISAGQTKQPATRRAKRSKNQFLSILTKRGGRGGMSELSLCETFSTASPPLSLQGQFSTIGRDKHNTFSVSFSAAEKKAAFFIACETVVIVAATGKNRTSANKTRSDFRAEKKLHQPPHEPQFELVCQKCGVRKSSVKRLSYL